MKVIYHRIVVDEFSFKSFLWWEMSLFFCLLSMVLSELLAFSILVWKNLNRLRTWILNLSYISKYCFLSEICLLILKCVWSTFITVSFQDFQVLSLFGMPPPHTHTQIHKHTHTLKLYIFKSSSLFF